MANTIETMSLDVVLRKIIDGTIEAFEDDVVRTIGKNRLRAINNLTLVYLSNCTTIGENGIYGSSRTKKGCILIFPDVITLGNSMCRDTYVSAIDIGASCSSIPTCCFYNGSATDQVQKIVLRRTDSIVAAAASDAIKLIGSQTTIYVPAALLSSYQSATNWSTKTTATWKTIESTATDQNEPVDLTTHYIDGTDIPIAP